MARRRSVVPALVAVAGAAAFIQLASAAQGGASPKWLAGSNLPGRPDACTPAILGQIHWGTGTSAMQVEGATNVGGRTDSVWDSAARSNAKLASDGSTPFDAVKHHDKYREDFKLMRELGIKNYRFSISWSRLIPQGVAGSAVSPAGAKFYSDFIDAMRAEGIEPAVTLYHWDLPQVLQDAYQGFTDEKLVRDFTYYAETAFKLYGDRVKAWVTFNEPWITCGLQYGGGAFPPGKNLGDAARYKCGHNLLLAHAAAVKLYRTAYKPRQGGVIGMAMWTEWAEPWRGYSHEGDRRAAQSKLDVDISWFADVIHFGDYPQKLKDSFKEYLPVFTDAQKAELKKSYDYFGITFYTGKWAAERPDNPGGWEVKLVDVNGKRVGEQAESYWLNNVPWSLTSMLKYINDRYDAPEIWVMENGFSEKGEAKRSGAARLKDPSRLNYFRGYIDAACKARKDGIKLTRFYTWSFVDNWEWKEGFSTDFGIVDVDFKNPALPRTPKDSARWLRTYIFPFSA